MAYDEKFIQKLIIKASLVDRNFLATVASAIDNPLFFQSTDAAALFERIREHFNKYEAVPTQDMVISAIPEKERDGVVAYLKEANALDIDTVEQYEFVLDKTDE